ncbi:salicylaldehyde dehydrogenase protein [Purpureocillium lavendulum]|uniref:Salicylaldehyde dehydrogenase protein n=1 Tax=Purpureocillium lavendulum TaxID=1247861 RepID=A0AB34FS39_9HYPO|nr:salicylaldehyde dehydrogenase protein [Purpureocillium lavendulum]
MMLATPTVTGPSTVTSSVSATPTSSGAPGDPGEVLKNWSSLIGIVTAIVGNVLIALALNVQRYAHTRLHKERARVRQRARAALKRAQSSTGASAGTYGAIGADGAERGNGHASAVAGDLANGVDGLDGSHGDHETDPLAASFQSSATTDVENGDDPAAKASSTYLKSPYWWLGQILITLGETGNFLAYGFAPASIVSPLGVVALVSNCIIAPAMFHERFRARDFWGVVIAVAGVVTVVLSANQEETKLEPHDVWDAITTMEFEVYMGVTVLLILILMWASPRYGRRTILIDLGLVGLFGGYTALATKGVSSMLSSTLWRAFTTPVTYALVFILLVTAIMQIRYVNKALQRFDSTQVIPIQFVLFTLCVILGSAVLYRDFEKTTAEQAAKFVGGCLLTFFGVFLITSGRKQQDEDEDLLSEAEGIEETIGLRHHEANGDTPARAAPSPKSQSRRSSRLSRVSFAETVKPISPSERDSIVRVTSSGAASAPDLLGDASSPLAENPWQSSWDPSTSSPGFNKGPSADPAVTPSVTASTPTQSFPSTPLRQPGAPPAYPTDRPVTPRPTSALARAASHHRSKTFISPSPLSSTVTTVFKDGFLREDDTPLAQRSSMRRIRSSIRASLFFNDEDAAGQSAIPAPDDHLHAALHRQETAGSHSEADDPGRRRSRSVSDALGDFFRPKKKNKTEQETPSTDDAAERSASTDADNNTTTTTTTTTSNTPSGPP